MKILKIEQGTVSASYWIEEEMKKMYYELYGDRNYTVIKKKIQKVETA